MVVWKTRKSAQNTTPVKETGRLPSNATSLEETLESVQNATPVEKTLRKRLNAAKSWLEYDPWRGNATLGLTYDFCRRILVIGCHKPSECKIAQKSIQYNRNRTLR